jgi:hypothetical protein
MFKKLFGLQNKIPGGLPGVNFKKILEIIKKNPELFKKISTEVKEKVKLGQNETSATQEVAEKYKEELIEIFKNDLRDIQK